MHALLQETRQLELDAEDLVGEGVEAHFVGEVERFHVVFHGGFGLQVVVGVEEGAAQVPGDGLGVGGEFADDVGSVNVVCVDEAEAGGDDAEAWER